MKLVNRIQDFLRQLDHRTFKKYLIASITISALIMIIMAYYIYNKSSSLIKQISKVEQIAFEANQIEKKYQKTQTQKTHLLSLLEKETDFEIKSFFEAFCKERQLKVESNWKTTSSTIEGNEKIEEVSLKASFKGQTTEKLIKILQDLDEKEIVYIKNIKIDKSTNKIINFDLTIATFKYK